MVKIKCIVQPLEDVVIQYIKYSQNQNGMDIIKRKGCSTNKQKKNKQKLYNVLCVLIRINIMGVSTYVYIYI